MPKMNNNSIFENKTAMSIYSIAFQRWTNKLQISQYYYKSKKTKGGHVSEVIDSIIESDKKSDEIKFFEHSPTKAEQCYKKTNGKWVWKSGERCPSIRGSLDLFFYWLRTVKEKDKFSLREEKIIDLLFSFKPVREFVMNNYYFSNPLERIFDYLKNGFTSAWFEFYQPQTDDYAISENGRQWQKLIRFLDGEEFPNRDVFIAPLFKILIDEYLGIKLHPKEEEIYIEEISKFRKCTDQKKFLIEEFLKRVEIVKKEVRGDPDPDMLVRQIIEALILRCYKLDILSIIIKISDEFAKTRIVRAFESDFRRVAVDSVAGFWERPENQLIFCTSLQGFIIGNKKLLRKDKEKPFGSLVNLIVEKTVDVEYTSICERDLEVLKIVHTDQKYTSNAGNIIKKNMGELIKSGIDKFSMWSYVDVMRCTEKLSRL